MVSSRGHSPFCSFNRIYKLSARRTQSARFVYFGGFRSQVITSFRSHVPALPIRRNTLGNDTGLSRANCFFELTRFQPRFHYARATFSGSKLEQDPGQFADAISFVAPRCSRAREPYTGIAITYPWHLNWLDVSSLKMCDVKCDAIWRHAYDNVIIITCDVIKVQRDLEILAKWYQHHRNLQMSIQECPFSYFLYYFYVYITSMRIYFFLYRYMYSWTFYLFDFPR